LIEKITSHPLHQFPALFYPFRRERQGILGSLSLPIKAVYIFNVLLYSHAKSGFLFAQDSIILLGFVIVRKKNNVL
jgi:hypothetical protein